MADEAQPEAPAISVDEAKKVLDEQKKKTETECLAEVQKVLEKFGCTMQVNISVVAK